MCGDKSQNSLVQDRGLCRREVDDAVEHIAARGVRRFPARLALCRGGQPIFKRLFHEAADHHVAQAVRLGARFAERHIDRRGLVKFRGEAVDLLGAVQPDKPDALERREVVPRARRRDREAVCHLLCGQPLGVQLQKAADFLPQRVHVRAQLLFGDEADDSPAVFHRFFHGAPP